MMNTQLPNNDFEEIAARLWRFNHKHDCELFHDAKNLALDLAIEVTEHYDQPSQRESSHPKV